MNRSTANTIATPTTVGDALQYNWQRLSEGELFYGHGTDNAWDEAVQLTLSCCGLPLSSDESVLQLALAELQWQQMLQLLQRRIHERVPLPYLLGRAWFAGMELLCDARALVPRSPLAELVQQGYAPWYSGRQPPRILDLCCGGGSIGLATAHYLPESEVVLCDIDADALALAGENVKFLRLGEQVTVLQSNLFEQLGERRFDIIVSNPPYVDAEDLAAMPPEYRSEPAIALGSGVDGLDLTRKILAQAQQYLSDDGLLVVEVGNSWEALEAAYPQVPFIWLEFESGGHGVFALTAKELQEFSARAWL